MIFLEVPGEQRPLKKCVCVCKVNSGGEGEGRQGISLHCQMQSTTTDNFPLSPPPPNCQGSSCEDEKELNQVHEAKLWRDPSSLLRWGVPDDYDWIGWMDWGFVQNQIKPNP